MKKFLLMAIVVLGAFGCKDAEEPPVILGTYSYTPVYFQVHNAAGTDLLNPKNKGYLNRIKLYKIVDGKEEFIDGNLYKNQREGCGITFLDYVPQYVTNKSIGKDWSFGLELPLFLPNGRYSDEGLRYDAYYDCDIADVKLRIEWDYNHSDVIEAEVRVEPGPTPFSTHKVWVNGKLQWTARFVDDLGILTKVID